MPFSSSSVFQANSEVHAFRKLSDFSSESLPVHFSVTIFSRAFFRKDAIFSDGILTSKKTPRLIWCHAFSTMRRFPSTLSETFVPIVQSKACITWDGTAIMEEPPACLILRVNCSILGFVGSFFRGMFRTFIQVYFKECELEL